MVTALLLLVILPVPATSRKILQNHIVEPSPLDQSSQNAAGSAGTKKSFDDASVPKDGTPFGADPGARKMTLSKMSPARQVASSKEKNEPRAPVVEEEQPAQQPEQAQPMNTVEDKEGGVEVAAMPDDGLFDEDSPSQPIVTAVNPDEFLEPPSADENDDKANDGEVADEDLFDEETPEVPIVTAVNPAEFIDQKSKQEEPGAAEEEERPKTRRAWKVAGRGEGKSDADDAAAPVRTYVDVDAIADAEKAEKQKEEEREASSSSPAPTVTPTPAPTPTPASTPIPAPTATPTADEEKVEDAAAPAAAVSAEAPAAAPKETSSAISADEWHAKKGHGRIPKKAAAGIKAKKSPGAAGGSAAEATAVAKEEDKAHPSSSSSSSFSSNESNEEKKKRSRKTKHSAALSRDGEQKKAAVEVKMEAVGEAPVSAPESSPRVADPAEKEKTAEDSDSEALAPAGSANDDKQPQLLTKANLSREPQDVAALVKKVALYPSDCVPDDTAVLVQVNYHHIPLFHAQVKNVIQRRCFMRRYVLLALDGRSMDECRKIQANGVELHCAKSKREYTAGGAGGGGVGLRGGGALSTEEMKDILFDRWTVVANVLEATPRLKLWVFDADVVIFKVPTLELPDGCDFSTQLDKLEALGAADGDTVEQLQEMLSTSSADVDGGDGGEDGAGGYRRLLLLLNDTQTKDGAQAQAQAPTPTLSLVPHTDRKRYSMNGGQVVLHNTPEVVAFLRAVGKRGENSDDLDYLVMTQLMQNAAGKPWESMSSCDLPETFSSACWGLAVDPFTFHANCVDSAEEKLKQMHNAVGLIASTVSPSTGEVTFAEGYPEGTSRYCWDQGMMCKGKCDAGKLCEIIYDGDAAGF